MRPAVGTTECVPQREHRERAEHALAAPEAPTNPARRGALPGLWAGDGGVTGDGRESAGWLHLLGGENDMAEAITVISGPYGSRRGSSGGAA